jgi:hypothetical protein
MDFFWHEILGSRHVTNGRQGKSPNRSRSIHISCGGPFIPRDGQLQRQLHTTLLGNHSTATAPNEEKCQVSVDEEMPESLRDLETNNGEPSSYVIL